MFEQCEEAKIEMTNTLQQVLAINGIQTALNKRRFLQCYWHGMCV